MQNKTIIRRLGFDTFQFVLHFHLFSRFVHTSKTLKVPMTWKFFFCNFIFVGKFFENDIITFFTVSRYLFCFSRYWGLFDIQIAQLVTSHWIMSYLVIGYTYKYFHPRLFGTSLLFRVRQNTNVIQENERSSKFHNIHYAV